MSQRSGLTFRTELCRPAFEGAPVSVFIRRLPGFDLRCQDNQSACASTTRPSGRRPGRGGSAALPRPRPAALCTVLPVVAAVRVLRVEGPPAASPEKPGVRV